MTLTIAATLPLIVAIIGLLMYFLSPHAKVAETGRIMFFCGLLSFLFAKH